ncbi:VOC family protein [Natronosporangium hydrolyticum]|uniref:VOC family protein n=1 Tax=Natronosporangium hydrolyticum TaxID=2811111 RepID=A0A895YMR1_9ACTN|nr:VOC family protein [Natronosporangium hydrolyticum]QSB15390.1 VOC family protein [Natronosporangium hydrolyticum]
MTKPKFQGGANIAMKVPAAKFAETVAFYRDVLGFDVIEEPAAAVDMVSHAVRMAFGDCTLWLDRVENYAKADVWLELRTDDLGAAVQHLADHGTVTQDELERLPEGSRAHWVCNPVAVPHLLHATPAS